jgi:hypothetical protein
MPRVFLVKFVGRTESAAIADPTKVRAALVDVAIVLGAGGARVEARREEGEPPSVSGVIACRGIVVTAATLPSDGLFVLDVLSSREVPKGLVDRVLRRHLGPYAGRIVELPTD